MVLICPDCDFELRSESYGGTQVESCSECGGVWLDAGELRKLIESPETLRSVEDESEPALEQIPTGGVVRRCPRCDSDLVAYNYLVSSPVELDSCAQCHGIWVQNDELGKVEEAVQRSRDGVGMSPEAIASVVRYTEDHKDLIGRQRQIVALFDLLRYRPGGRLPQL